MIFLIFLFIYLSLDKLLRDAFSLTKDDKPVTVNFPQTELTEEAEKYIEKIKEKINKRH